MAPDQIIPSGVHVLGRQITGTLRVRQAKTPMGLAAFAHKFREFVLRQFQTRAIVDRRLVKAKLALAAAVQFVLGLEARIQHAGRAQLVGRFLVALGAVGLARGAVPRQPEPGQVIANGVREFFGRTLAVGVVESQQKRAAKLPGVEPVQRRRPDVADVDASRWTGRKADARGHEALGFDCDLGRTLARAASNARGTGVARVKLQYGGTKGARREPPEDHRPRRGRRTRTRPAARP